MQANTLINKRAIASGFHGFADNMKPNYNTAPSLTTQKGPTSSNLEELEHRDLGLPTFVGFQPFVINLSHQLVSKSFQILRFRNHRNDWMVRGLGINCHTPQ